MFNILNHKENGDQNNLRFSLTIVRMATIAKTNACEDVEEKEPYALLLGI
jgi:hypothetical protein